MMVEILEWTIKVGAFVQWRDDNSLIKSSERGRNMMMKMVIPNMYDKEELDVPALVRQLEMHCRPAGARRTCYEVRTRSENECRG